MSEERNNATEDLKLNSEGGNSCCAVSKDEGTKLKRFIACSFVSYLVKSLLVS